MRWLSNDSRGPDRTNDQSPAETASTNAPITPKSPPPWPSSASARVSTRSNDSTSPGEKFGDGQAGALALQKPSGPHAPRATPPHRRDRAHRQCARHPTLELDRHNLVVGYIFVTCVDAAPVLAVAQRPPYPRFCQVGRNNGERPALPLGVAQAAKVEPQGGVRAFGLHGTVQAPVGCAGRPAGCSEGP